MSVSTKITTLPPRPRLVLRAGFAGSQRLVSDEELLATPLPDDAAKRAKEEEDRKRSVDERVRLEATLPLVLETLGRRLAAILPHLPVDHGKEPAVAGFFEESCPLLRLVTGLCQGADALAGDLIQKVRVTPDPGASCSLDIPCLDTELAAVLPFDVESYRNSRPASFQAKFDEQLQRCAWVLELDGKYEKPVVDTPRAKNRRSRGYRAQSAFLLRQSDVLIAAANPDDETRAGGTLETVRNALAFELPVIFIHTGMGGDNVYLIGPDDDLHSVLAAPAPTPAAWKAKLTEWVSQLTADPDSKLSPSDKTQREAREQGEALLNEYFYATDAPRMLSNGNRRLTFREKVWNRFWECFKTGPKSKGDPKLAPFSDYRTRATNLNYHYSGLYRGAFLLNYSLAIVAVALAALSLMLLGTAGHTAVGDQIATLIKTAGHSAGHSVGKIVSAAPQPWLLPLLLGLAALKLLILIFISRNTQRANREHWNDRAVDYRYLAERLRGMYYLPLVGSHQPPVAAPPQFASRVVRQSAVDWLFDSLVRAISPADLPHAAVKVFPMNAEHGELTVKKLLTVDPRSVVEKVRDCWVIEQANYHEANAESMHALHHRTEMAALRLGWIVIVIVAFDLLLIGGKVMHWLPDALVPFAKGATPWLILLATVVPAVVAALGGLRFQSECQRLAERSAVMKVMMVGRTIEGVVEAGGRKAQADELATRMATAAASPDTDPGSWAHDALRLTERVATDFVQEAAEWSVLYAKEVSDPG